MVRCNVVGHGIVYMVVHVMVCWLCQSDPRLHCSAQSHSNHSGSLEEPLWLPVLGKQPAGCEEGVATYAPRPPLGS